MDRVKQWVKRLGCFFVIILWIVAMLFPTFAFVLAAQGQIQLGDGERSHVRFFMVREVDGEGIGVELKRPSPDHNQCFQNSITYLLWEGTAASQNNSYCQCYDPVTNAPLPVLENKCHLP